MTSIISSKIKNAKLTNVILHQWIGEGFPLFVIDNYTVFSSFTWKVLLVKCVESAILRGGSL